MILRRLAEAMRGQDWFTVVIEVLVVVVGIFIGLQVDDWNDARKDQVLARDYLSRLIVDVEQEIADKDSALQRLALKQAALLRISAALSAYEDGDGSGAVIKNAGQFLIDIRRSTNFGWFSGAVFSPTFDEMTSSGALALIMDPAMRKLINGYYQYLQVQSSRTVARVTGYANMIYRLAPPQLMAVDQLAPDEEILALTPTIEVQSILAKFHDAGLEDYINAELSFGFFLEREHQESRVVAQSLKDSIKAYLAGEEVSPVSQPPVG